MQFSNKFYDTIKWICLVAIPALSAFLGAVLPLIGILPDITTKIILVINALGAFMGALIGISTAAYNKNENMEDKPITTYTTWSGKG